MGGHAERMLEHIKHHIIEAAKKAHTENRALKWTDQLLLIANEHPDIQRGNVVAKVFVGPGDSWALELDFPPPDPRAP